MNIDNNFFINGITIANLDGIGNLEIIASERISSTEGRIHALGLNAESISMHWPVTIPGTPAFTPSVGEINNDQVVDLVTSTTTALYAFDATGGILPGFPVTEDGAKFSYQSPILADLDGNDKREIITARHNDAPGTVVVNSAGEYHGQWPDYDNGWTFATPAVVDIDGDQQYEIFYPRPFISETNPSDVVLAYTNQGFPIEDFRIIDLIGSEGILAIADIDNDSDYEIITASNGAVGGMGMINAYHFENGNAVSNFPIFVEGFTLLNGASLGDIDKDGLLDLTALSYQLKFNSSSPDSAFVNAFDLGVPYDENTILWNGYKNSNSHDGKINRLVTNVSEEAKLLEVIYPNPATSRIYLRNFSWVDGEYMIYKMDGKMLRSGAINSGEIDLEGLPSGLHLLKIDGEVFKFVKL